MTDINLPPHPICMKCSLGVLLPISHVYSQTMVPPVVSPFSHWKCSNPECDHFVQ